MPTPHGTRGGLAFSADEVRVVRRALAEVLHPSRSAAVAAACPVPAVFPVPAALPAAAAGVPAAGAASPAAVVAPRSAEYAGDYLRLAEAVDDAVHEAGRLRAFLLAELRRYRQALPGTAAGYLDRLTAALAGGYLPGPDDLAALRRLRALPCGTPEYERRTAVLRRCETLAENDVRLRLEAHMPAPRRLLTLPLLADEPEPAPGPRPARPADPDKPHPPAPQDPGRRTPTPAEIWPPHRRARKPDQPDRPGKQDQPDRPDQPGKPAPQDAPDRPDGSGRSGRLVCSVGSDRSGRSDGSARSACSARSGRSARSDGPDRSSRFDRSGASAGRQRPDHARTA